MNGGWPLEDTPPIERLVRPFQEFAKLEASGGILLIGCAISWLATRSRVAAMLDGVSWRQVVGVGLLGGIGFTMSLFIANLAFGDAPLLETAKVGILGASVASGVAGVIVLLRRGKALTPLTENIRSES